MKKLSSIGLAAMLVLAVVLAGCGAPSDPDEMVIDLSHDGTGGSGFGDRDGSTCNESTVIMGFKIEPWNVLLGMFWTGQSFSSTVRMEVNDYTKEGKALAKFGR